MTPTEELELERAYKITRSMTPEDEANPTQAMREAKYTIYRLAVLPRFGGDPSKVPYYLEHDYKVGWDIARAKAYLSREKELIVALSDALVALRIRLMDCGGGMHAPGDVLCKGIIESIKVIEGFCEELRKASHE